jgi:hypothetical protein
VGMVVNALWTDPINTGITFAIIATGIPVYFARKAWFPAVPAEEVR